MVGTVLLDRYRLDDRIAAGGMGTVWSASDERLGRKVAVKTLKGELAHDARFVERFRREARAVAALGHPNIANVFDYGEDGDQHFIVMELVEGRDLARLLREEGPMSVDRALRIGAQASEALGHAHAAGVVHRDVKPANIIVGPGDRVKVTDFGIARAVGDSTLTATGSVLGTAHYLSPEQASGSEVGPPSDVYSMGCVLYEMLTGATPFTGDSPIGIAMRHVSDAVPPPSALNQDVPEPVDALVAKATAKEPGDRFPDGRALAEALSGAVHPTDEDAIATVPAGAAAAPTAAMTGATAAQEAPGTTPQTVWPVSDDRWEPRRVGRIVLAAFAALLAIALLLLLVRLFTGDDETEPAAGRGDRRQENAGGGADQPEPAEITLESYIGDSYEEAAAALDDLGLKAQQDVQDDDDPAGVVIGQEPSEGETVTEGSTVVLTVSNGAFVPDENGDEDEGEGEEDSSGPGSSEDQGEGKAKGKDKDKGKGKGED